MAQVGPYSGLILKQALGYTRVFWFGTTGQTVVVNLSKAGGAFAAAAGAVSELPAGGTGPAGWYKIVLTNIDTNTLGDLAYHCTAGSGGPLDFIDVVQSQTFQNDITLTSGQPSISSYVKQNQALNGFQFVMTQIGTGQLLTGLGTSITAQRSLGGAGFSPCTNTPSEVGNGVYTINLSSGDLATASVALRFSAATANDNIVILITQP